MISQEKMNYLIVHGNSSWKPPNKLSRGKNYTYNTLYMQINPKWSKDVNVKNEIKIMK